MNLRKFPLGSLAVILSVIPVASLAATFHVAPSGSDRNPGDEQKPFATLQRARDAIRELKQSQGAFTEPVEVILRGGEYYLAETLVLGPEDSGTEQAPVTWRSAAGEKVLVSGGSVLAGEWRTDDRRIWYLDLPAAGGLQHNFRQLFVEGKRAVRARYPNVSTPNPFLYATGGTKASVRIDQKLLKKSWGEATDAQINLVPDWRFYNQWNTVKGVNLERGEILLQDSELHGPIIKGNWFWIEGVKEELDEPGEWFLEPSTHRLYYMPAAGVDPNGLKIVAPLLNRLVYARGEVEKGTQVQWVNFAGLEFQHTDFTLGQIEARVATDAAIMFENASDCGVVDCRFENIGGYALWLHLDSQRNLFSRNQVYYSGAGGVLLTGARFSYMDESKIYTPGPAAAEVFPILNRITHNIVKHAGKIRYYGGGVHLDSRPFSMSMSPGNYIAHNYFADLSRNGIFAFRNQGGNVIEYNHIHDVMQTTIDGAAIHFATMNRLAAPNYILNNYLYDIWGFEQMSDGKPHRVLANGVFLDWATSNTTVKDNYIYNTGQKDKPIKPIFGNWNLTIADNITAEKRIVPPFLAEVGPAGQATHGIKLAETRLQGNVIHYSNQERVRAEGGWQQHEIAGLRNLFSFSLLKAGPSKPASITYQLPVAQAGVYQISLIYLPEKDNASNAKIRISHAEGVAETAWNMQKGHEFGFAVEVGEYRFAPGQPAQVSISNEGADGIVVADSVGFVWKRP